MVKWILFYGDEMRGEGKVKGSIVRNKYGIVRRVK